MQLIMDNNHPAGALARSNDLESRPRFWPHGHLCKADSSGVGTHDANSAVLAGARETFPSVVEIVKVSPGKFVVVIVINRIDILRGKAAECLGAIGKRYGQCGAGLATPRPRDSPSRSTGPVASHGRS